MTNPKILPQSAHQRFKHYLSVCPDAKDWEIETTAEIIAAHNLSEPVPRPALPLLRL
jgi:hypothetical protein